MERENSHHGSTCGIIIRMSTNSRSIESASKIRFRVEFICEVDTDSEESVDRFVNAMFRRFSKFPYVTVQRVLVERTDDDGTSCACGDSGDHGDHGASTST